jgi:hypothetical protein
MTSDVIIVYDNAEVDGSGLIRDIEQRLVSTVAKVLMKANVAGTLLVFAALAAAPVHAAPEPFGASDSDRVLQGSLTLPDGKTVQFGSREGTLVSVRNDREHYWMAFEGAFEHGVERITVELFDVKPVSADEAIVVSDGRPPTEIAKGTSHKLSTASGTFTFSYRAAIQGHFSRLPFDPRWVTPEEAEKNRASGDRICCVTCGTATVCASSVVSDCGSCE